MRAALRQLKGRAGGLAGFVLAAFAATGAFAFYNTNTLNRYETTDAANAHAVGYEKKYLGFARLPQPSVAHRDVSIDLYPEDRRARTRGTFLLKNRTGETISTVHVRVDDRTLQVNRLVLHGAKLASHDRTYGYRIFRLDRPMAPDETRTLSFVTDQWRRGVANGPPDVRITRNGTFLTAQDLVPTVGVRTQPLVADPAVREQFGLPPAGRAKLEDLSATALPADENSWSTADITVSTRADQTPVAPGHSVSERVRGDRRIAAS